MLFLGKIIFGDEIFIQQNSYYLPVKIRKMKAKSLSIILKSNKLKASIASNKAMKCRILSKKEKSILSFNNLKGRVR